MIRRALLQIAVFACFVAHARGASWYRQYRVPPELGSGMLFRAAETPDGSLVAVYTTERGAPASRRVPVSMAPRPPVGHVGTCYGAWEIVAMKFGASGDVQWSYVLSSATCLQAYAIVATPDGGAMIGAHDESDFETAVLLRLGSDGHVLWSRTYTLSSSGKAGGVVALKRLSENRYAGLFGLLIVTFGLGGIPESAEAFEAASGEGGSFRFDVQFTALDALPDGRYVAATGGMVLLQGEQPFGAGIRNIEAIRALPDETFVARSMSDEAVTRIRKGGKSLWSVDPGLRTSGQSADIDAEGNSWSGQFSVDTGRPQLNIIRSDGTADSRSYALTAAPAERLSHHGSVVAGNRALWLLVRLGEGSFAVFHDERLANGCMTAEPGDTNVATSLRLSEGGTGMLIGKPAFASPSDYPVTLTCMAVSASPLCAVASAGRAAMVQQTPPNACAATKIEFEFTDAQRVILHKYRPEGRYPSKYQQRLADDPKAPPADHRIEVGALVTTSGLAVPNKAVYFRVLDPADTAPYIPNAHADDNRDSARPKGELVGRTPCALAPPAGIACSMSGDDGFASVILNTSESVAGENYIVEAAADPAFACGTLCPRSGTITTWKRVYAEVYTMLRKSSFLKEDVGPAAGMTTAIRVLDVRPFPTTGPFQVVLMRGRSLTDPSRNRIESEIVNIKTIRKDRFAESGDLELDQSDPANRIRLDYQKDAALPNKLSYGVNADAVAPLPAGRASFYVPSAAKVGRLFEDAFVEYVWIVDAASAPGEFPAGAERIAHDNAWIPYHKVVDHSQSQLMALRWIGGIEYTPLVGPPAPLTPFGLVCATLTPPSYQPLLIAARSSFQGGLVSGATFHERGHRPTWIYTETANAQSSDPNYVPWVTAHELGHQWELNTSAPVHYPEARGHCGGVKPVPPIPQQPVIPRWNGIVACLMTDDALNKAPSSTRVPEIAFHYRVARTDFMGRPIAAREDSEYLDIRTAPEPFPQRP